MKSKNKFTNNFNLISITKNLSNNFKNNKYINTYINVIIIAFIVVFSIYLLYFNNNNIHIQDAIMNSLDENNDENNDNEDSLVENFNVSKYVDICKKRNTNYYNLNPVLASARNITDCEKMCDANNCHAFTFQSNNNNCYTYTAQNFDSSNVDTRTTPIKINCNSKVFDSSYGLYNGIGYMNKVYYQNNKHNLDYLDPYLEESINVLGNLYSIENKRLQLGRLNPTSPAYSVSYDLIRTPMINEEKLLFKKFTTINRDIFDASRNILFTDIFNSSDTDNSILTPIPRDISYIIDLDNKDNISKKFDNLGGMLDVLSENGLSYNLRYLILAFIMVITIIILILYKSSNYINEKILVVYIIIITLLVLFITHHLKL